MTQGERDHFLSWEFAIACLRAEKESGRKLTPAEMVELAEREVQA